MVKKEVCEIQSKDLKIPRGRKGFDVGLELGAACRVTLGHVKTGDLKQTQTIITH